MHLYRFLDENNWFGNESKFRNFSFFINCSDKFGKQIPEEYNQEKIKEIWGKLIQNGK